MQTFINFLVWLIDGKRRWWIGFYLRELRRIKNKKRSFLQEIRSSASYRSRGWFTYDQEMALAGFREKEADVVRIIREIDGG